MVNPRLLLDLVERVGSSARGATVTIPFGQSERDRAEALVAAWCARTGNQLVEISDHAVTVRCGQIPDPLAELSPDQIPGTRLWLYTNFDCNLACDYCCARSSPHTPRRGLGLERITRLAHEAVDAGVSELLLTGGEPFLLPDIDQIAAVCGTALPTTLLTNGMLFRGARLDRLRHMNRDRVTIQISLDSATPDLHDTHRGTGSWQRAVDGIRTATAEGFRVRVAATLPPEHVHQANDLRVFLDSLGIARADQVIRALAHRGVADTGLELTVESLIPEVTVTADGVYWHPVGVDHNDQLVTRDLFPLQDAITEVGRRFAEHRARTAAAAQWFACA